MKTSWIFILALIIMAPAYAQDYTNLAIDGLVKEDGGGRLTGAKVSLYQDGRELQTQTSERNGRFEFFLDFDHEFTIKVSKSGFVEKIIYVNTHGVPEDEQAFGYEWPITVELFKRIDGVDYSLLSKPIGKIYYEANVQNFVGDNAYARQIKDELKRLEDEQRAAEKAMAEQSERLQEDFNLAVNDAQAAMNDQDYLLAKDNLLAAESMKPGSSEVASMLQQVEAKLQEEGDKEAQYQSVLSSADQALNSGNYSNSIDLFNQAIALKSDEDYPKQRLKEAQQRLQQEQAAQAAADKNAAQEKEYQNLISKADDAFEKGQFRDAKMLYQNALAIKDEAYPREQLGKIDGAIAEAEAASKANAEREQLETRYAERIDKANTAFQSGNLDNAEAFYREALALKPNEVYPQDQLAAIASQREAQAQALAAEQERAFKEKAYKDLLVLADQAFASKQLDLAEAKYTEALALKKEEAYPSEQIEKIKQQRAQLLAEKDAKTEHQRIEQAYQSAIQNGDQLFNSGDFLAAKKAYEEALNLKPREAYPDTQLKRVEKELASIAQKQEEEESYKRYLAKAEERYQSDALESAMESLREALKIKPNDPKATDRLNSISNEIEQRKRLAEQEAGKKAQEEQFKSLIADGDAAFNGGNYKLALEKYEEALKIKDDAYANEQLAKTRQSLNKKEDEDNRLAMEKERKLKFVSTLEKAKLEVSAGELQRAKETYNLAGTYAADETDHLDGIKAVEDLIASREAEALRLANQEEERKRQEEARSRYNEIMRIGNERMASGDYDEAKAAFQEAQQILPDENLPAEKLKNVDNLIAEAKRKEEQERFNRLVKEADRLFLEDQLEASVDKYKEAANIIGSSNYVKERIDKANQLIAERDSKQTVEEEDSHRRVIVETYDEGRTKVTVCRVILDGKEEVYKRVVHSWGGRYYFLDDQPITELVWNRETAK